MAECLLALAGEPTRLGGRTNLPVGSFAVIEHPMTRAADHGQGDHRRARCASECLGLCMMQGTLVAHRGRQIALAGIVAPPDHNELWIIERHLAGYRALASVAIPPGQPVLVPAARGKRFAEQQAHVNGSPGPELQLLPDEQMLLYVLNWRPADGGWEGWLYAVIFDTRTGALRLHYLLSVDE